MVGTVTYKGIFQCAVPYFIYTCQDILDERFGGNTGKVIKTNKITISYRQECLIKVGVATQ